MTNATTPTPREKTITVEGVQIRITRMNAFEQNDVLELMAGPMGFGHEGRRLGAEREDRHL